MKFFFKKRGAFIITLILTINVLLPLSQVTAQNVRAEPQSPGEKGYSLWGNFCDGDVITGSNGERKCGFKDFMFLINRVINFLLYFALILATFTLVYAGFLMLTSGGNTGKVDQAKEMFGKVVVGFLFAFFAWTIVHFILKSLGVGDDSPYTMLQ